MWTARQRAAIVSVLCFILALLLYRYLRNPIYISDPQPLEPARMNELADRIDPNTADAATLAALPTLGEKRAQMIVDYRLHFHQMIPSAGPAYQRLEDLMRIRGIGLATVDQLRPFLTFPTTQPTIRKDQ